MGITTGAIKLLSMALGSQTYQRALSLGVQSVGVDQSKVITAFNDIGKNFTWTRNESICSAIFHSLGCEQLETLDIYPDEGPTHIVDLNKRIPTSYDLNYDLVYDGGTLEHCFNVPEVMKNIVRLLRVGGRVVHHTPMNNWTDHGFYQISPTLFFDFYSAAGFRDLRLRLHFINGRDERQIELHWPRDPLPYGIGKGIRVLSHFSAVKAQEIDMSDLSTLIQTRYRIQFEGDGAVSPKVRQRSRWDRLRNSVKKRTIYLRASKL